jgi:hypothetical protein
VTFFSFEVLQRKSDQALQDAGISGLPADRTILENIHTTSGGVTIGEGKLVRMKAFIVRAYLAGKETVNCKESGPEAADIHIVLGDSLDDEGCETLTAEISPHFRPDEWTSEKLESVDVPVRITGHLFYDASHRPCTATKASKPARFSSWEVHPVYRVDVCTKKSFSACTVEDDSEWIPFHTLFETDEDDPE